MRNVKTKMRALSYIGAEKITLPLNPTYRQTDRQIDGQTYRQTYRQTDIQTYKRTDISVYRVAAPLKRITMYIKYKNNNY